MHLFSIAAVLRGRIPALRREYLSWGRRELPLLPHVVVMCQP